jgi:hypothetical protein
MQDLWAKFHALLLGLAGLVLPWLLFVQLAQEVWEKEGLQGDCLILQLLHAHGGPA